eukprot:TRINITY_DN15601_c0_g1_i1.p1 TRINITY_DN15601_c0_g1~~TRINITY_DN15601_c0_g1_i1.p1  ORF type:complete len:145 (-),score=4.99 TRINITY_DN15601_c0_g1_i1:1-435(-)
MLLCLCRRIPIGDRILELHEREHTFHGLRPMLRVHRAIPGIARKHHACVFQRRHDLGMPLSSCAIVRGVAVPVANQRISPAQLEDRHEAFVPIVGRPVQRCIPIVRRTGRILSLIHISEPTRLLSISYAVFCLKKKTRLQSQLL